MNGPKNPHTGYIQGKYDYIEDALMRGWNEGSQYTARQIIEICKDARDMSEDRFKKKYKDFEYSFVTVNNIIKYIESCYGGTK